MNGWQAIVEIVKSFNREGRYHHALIAMGIFAVVFIGVTLLTTLGAQMLGAVIQSAIAHWG